MGCLNPNNGFSHWFGNIHLSGPCNRSCYFCIGQHMMALDRFNTLNTWPLPGMDEFLAECATHAVKEVNLTGTNTDPSLYRHQKALAELLWDHGLSPGIRTNGGMPIDWRLYDRASLSIPTFDPERYRKIMGSGEPPTSYYIKDANLACDLKVNIVLGPHNTKPDLWQTLDRLQTLGVRRVNLREPYGQPHVGNPMETLFEEPSRLVHGAPTYDFHGGDFSVTYWDVHYCEVESVNLYANGRISVLYPITAGHDPSGTVLGQEHWDRAERHNDQWILS